MGDGSASLIAPYCALLRLIAPYCALLRMKIRATERRRRVTAPSPHQSLIAPCCALLRLIAPHQSLVAPCCALLRLIAPHPSRRPWAVAPLPACRVGSEAVHAGSGATHGLTVIFILDLIAPCCAYCALLRLVAPCCAFLRLVAPCCALLRLVVEDESRRPGPPSGGLASRARIRDRPRLGRQRS